MESDNDVWKMLSISSPGQSFAAWITFHIFNTSHCTHKGRVFHNIRKHLKHCEQLLLCVYYFNGKKLNYCPKEKYLGQLPILKTLLASQKTRRYKKGFKHIWPVNDFWAPIVKTGRRTNAQVDWTQWLTFFTLTVANLQ